MATYATRTTLTSPARMRAALEECHKLVDHAISLGIAVQSVSIVLTGFQVTTDVPFPAEQETHLDVTRTA